MRQVVLATAREVRVQEGPVPAVHLAVRKIVGCQTAGALADAFVASAERFHRDQNKRRLELARSLGASLVETDVPGAAGEHPDGFDCVVDATGAQPVIQQGLEAVRRGGKLMIFGVATEDSRLRLSPFRVYNDEVTIVGSMAVLDTFLPAIELLRGGSLETGPLLTHTFPLDGFEDALSAMRAGEGSKVQVLPNG